MSLTFNDERKRDIDARKVDYDAIVKKLDTLLTRWDAAGCADVYVNGTTISRARMQDWLLHAMDKDTFMTWGEIMKISNDVWKIISTRPAVTRAPENPAAPKKTDIERLFDEMFAESSVKTTNISSNKVTGLFDTLFGDKRTASQIQNDLHD